MDKPCLHDVTERDVAATFDGMCPLCMKATSEQKDAVIADLKKAAEEEFQRAEASIFNKRWFQEEIVKRDMGINVLEEALEYSNKILELLLDWVRLSRKMTVELSAENNVEVDSLKSKLLACIKAGNNCIAINREILSKEKS